MLLLFALQKQPVEQQQDHGTDDPALTAVVAEIAQRTEARLVQPHL